MKRELSYRTFDELMDEVRIDFSMYELEGMIEPQQLIKAAHRVTYDLGLRIRQIKEAFIELNHHNARLPDDFYVMNFAFLSYQYREYETSFLPGLHTEGVIVDMAASAVADCPTCYVACDCNSCCKDGDPAKDCTRVIQVVALKPECYCVRDYYHTERLSFRKSRYISPDCDPRHTCRYVAEIKDNHLFIPEIDCGKVFISYQGDMTDADGNLMVVDNPKANDYYEWECKVAILESLMFSKEDVAQQLKYAQGKRDEARLQAQSWANMPDFQEMKKAWEMNRQAKYLKYIKPFVTEYPYRIYR